jgi:hypothetical protein
MKLTSIILEVGEYKAEEKALEKDISNKFNIDRVMVSLGDYAGGRSDDDPLKDMSFGSITFLVNSDFEKGVWNKILDYVKSLGYDIQSDSNYFEEDPGERYYYPKIKFHFKRPSN